MKRGNHNTRTTFVFLLLWIGFFQSTFVFGQKDIEEKKIEFLLHEVETLKDAKFWRNGSSYSPKQAADHLRMKYGRVSNDVKTAKDFIDKVASKSSQSGRMYVIEFNDGKRITTSAFLYQRLAAWKP